MSLTGAALRSIHATTDRLTDRVLGRSARRVRRAPERRVEASAEPAPTAATLAPRIQELFVAIEAERERTMAREEELIAQAFRSRRLADAVRRLAGALDPGTLHGAVAEGAREYTQARAARLWLASRTGRDEPVVRTCGDVPHDAAAAVVSTPLVLGGQTLGVLEVWPDPEQPPLLHDVIDGLEVLAATAAAAIEASRLHARLADQSTRDALTGLFNRRRLDEDLALEAAYAERSGEPLTAIMMDIDHFKRVNDQRGHLAGDQLLREAADLLSGAVRASDAAYRYGGEEFVLLLRNQEAEAGRQFAERLRSSLARRLSTRGITASFGVASMPAHAGGARDLLRAADSALYASKRAGRDCVTVASPGEVARSA